MNQIIKGVMALMSLAPNAYGGDCHVVRKQVVVQNEVAIVPFVAPLGVVIPGSPFYSYRGAAQSYGQAQSMSAEDAQLLEEFKEFKRQRQAQVKAAVVPQTLLQQNCVKCHTENADAREHFDMSKELTADQKLAASRALLKGVMPKGKAIDDKTRGNLLGELLGVEETK